MNTPAKSNEKALGKRFRRLGQRLNSELGFHDQRLRFRTTPSRMGLTTWRLESNRPIEEPWVVSTDVAALLATATHDRSALFFSYYEEWSFSGKASFKFKASNLKFAVASPEADVPLLHFRLEWASGEQSGKTLVYPGKGAAHPHWQFDLHETWFSLGPTEGDAVDLELADETVETLSLEPPSEYSSVRMSSSLSSFHRLHLPARAMWHEMLCVMPDEATPQQHSPTDAEEIDRWIISALRYVKHEFDLYC